MKSRYGPLGPTCSEFKRPCSGPAAGIKQANTSERQSPQLVPQRRPLLPHVNVEHPKSSFHPSPARARMRPQPFPDMRGIGIADGGVLREFVHHLHVCGRVIFACPNQFLEMLRQDIHFDIHSRTGDIRVQCRVLIRVRNDGEPN